MRHRPAFAEDGRVAGHTSRSSAEHATDLKNASSRQWEEGAALLLAASEQAGGVVGRCIPLLKR